MGSLRKWWVPASLAALAAVATAAAGFAGDQRDITVENRTGEVIQSLYISPVDVDDWEEDVLGVDVLQDGESVDVAFSGYEEGQCRFDVLAKNEAGDAWLLTDLDLCRIETITITAKYVKAK